MNAGADLIFFDQSEDWQLAARQTRVARRITPKTHEPILGFDLGTSFDTSHVGVIAGTTKNKNTWILAGDIVQTYDFPAGGSNSVTGKIMTPPVRIFINRLQVVNTVKISPDPFRLQYTPPKWFEDCTIQVYRYVGDRLNFVEDTLFDIGNALGVDPNTGEGLIQSQLTVIEELISDKFSELQLSRRAEIELDNLRETAIQQQISQISSGVVALADGIGNLLPPGQSEEFKREVRDSLNLDLGFT